MKEKMIIYLQEMLDSFEKEKNKYGADDRIVCRKFDAMIACKEMAESLIGEPVNIGTDGKVTVGF